MSSTTAAAPTAAINPALKAVEDAAIRKAMWRLVPILMLGYFFNYIDRTSVGFAALQMNRELGLTATQFGWGAGIMFASYCLLEVPSNMAMYRFGARRWLARIMITWGLAAAATAFAVGPLSFYGLRFLLGVFEAGFFPGVIWYLSVWFPARSRTRVLAWFMAATPLSSLIGGPVSSSLLEMHGVLGLSGWQWMFIVEGLPACLLGLLCLALLSDAPKDAAWLTPEERAALTDALARERHESPRHRLGEALRDRRVLALAGITFAFTIGSYGVGIWLPLILKGHGLSTLTIGFVSAIPYFFATVAMLLWARVADRTGRKLLNMALALSCGVVGLVMSVLVTSLVPALVGLTLALIGTISARTVFYTIPQTFLTGAAAAGGLAFINSVGAAGGFVGPFMVGWLKDATGSYDAGMLGMAVVLMLALGLNGLLVLFMRGAPKSAPAALPASPLPAGQPQPGRS
ncbi:MFS transporter [Methylobacterium sp. E-066]|uniref:MFS transporter n=1 Tax=Methylobacterium sp. E-066 TaxID=2836584 RepID=UPI001FB8693A|nr:MFS transporter [Methylobacterium sp. E-066]MCJ2144762.1 MFS transporter [Methylobacterium sp. E-066]